ncbi:MAG: C69 family dipeptidase [Anaerolineales bacterium]|nr:C69 family dipeptidase [Anaerolineales bacterium]MDW8160602.1 C69 family dipeptidase [Anaerolineales bacterium]
MCDTLVAVGNSTVDGSVILAKNSDREPNEAHVLVHLPRQKHPPHSTVKCTYIEIPQVEETYEVFLSKPFWIWGCEMGVNEYGVAIGNEAVFTKEPYQKEKGLIGMDLIRLALERSQTAYQALQVIVELIDRYGQGGNCGFEHPTYYHNSFILADPNEAWVLETAGKYWAAERVKDVRSISNGLTIGETWDEASPGLVEHAVEKGWCKPGEDFHFARCYSDFLYTRLDGCRPRQCRSTELLKQCAGSIDAAWMMRILRDHGPRAETDPLWDPSRGWIMDTLCVHASFGPTRPSQSTGAMIAHLSSEFVTIWATGTSATCTSIFKPLFLCGEDFPPMGRTPTGKYDPDTLWWQHERLHRQVIRDYPNRIAVYREERDALEREFIQETAEALKSCRESNQAERAQVLTALSRRCFERSIQATHSWIEKVAATPLHKAPSRLFSLSWRSFNKRAGFPEI